MDIRMLPIRHVFERFPRLVRDLARQQGKQIELILQGEDTRVDKAVIDEIGEPLVHLIRNAVDHGIEAPALRVARAARPPTGTHPALGRAGVEPGGDHARRRRGGHRRRRGAPQGASSAGSLQRRRGDLTDREAIQLIFTEGFSTAADRHRRLGPRGRARRGGAEHGAAQRADRGETIPGAGTKFILQLPLTLAIITVLMVEVGGRGLRAAARRRWSRACASARRDVHAHQRARHAARPRPHRAAAAPRRAASGVPRGRRRRDLRGDRGPRREAPRPDRRPAARASRTW